MAHFVMASGVGGCVREGHPPASVTLCSSSPHCVGFLKAKYKQKQPLGHVSEETSGPGPEKACACLCLSVNYTHLL